MCMFWYSEGKEVADAVHEKSAVNASSLLDEMQKISACQKPQCQQLTVLLKVVRTRAARSMNMETCRDEDNSWPYLRQRGQR